MVDQSGIMHVRRWGKITRRDEDCALEKRRQGPMFVPGIPVIVDCREVDPPDTTTLTHHVASRVSAMATALDCGPVAIVVSSEVEFGMARMFMALTESKHPNTEAFRSYDEALGWLKNQPDKFFKSARNL
jgi:hypothetical protein